MSKQNKIHYTADQVKTWLNSRFPKVDWSQIENSLPPIIWRARWDELSRELGLPYSRKYMQNLDSRNEGPGSV